MRMRDYLEQASVRGVPDWLISEFPSRDGGAIRDEWARILADPKADEGSRRLAAAMLKLRGERPTRPLMGRANAKALRWVESTTNRSKLAQQLRKATPSLRLSQKVLLSLNGYAWRTATIALAIFVKVGLFSAIDGVTRVVERASRLHIDRHIGPLT